MSCKIKCKQHLYCGPYTVSHFIISKLQQTDWCSVFVGEGPVSVQYFGAVCQCDGAGKQPTNLYVLYRVCIVMLRLCSLCYWQHRQPIGCSAQVQPSHWSKVEWGVQSQATFSRQGGGRRKHPASNLTAILPPANISPVVESIENLYWSTSTVTLLMQLKVKPLKQYLIQVWMCFQQQHSIKKVSVSPNLQCEWAPALLCSVVRLSSPHLLHTSVCLCVCQGFTGSSEIRWPHWFRY